MFTSQQLTQAIFDYLAQVDAQAKYPEHYVVAVQQDSNCNEFEGLSNNNMIILKSRMSEIQDKIALQSIHAVLDNNYWRLEDIDEEDEDEDEETQKEIDNITNVLSQFYKVDDAKFVSKGFVSSCEFEDSCETDDIPVEADYYRNRKYKSFPQTVLSVEQLCVTMTLTPSGIIMN
jgi:hypothetical protein